MPSQIDTDRTKQRLRGILDKMLTDADPHQLNEYRSLIRKEVPFFRRSYMAAYLLMLMEQREDGKSLGNSRSKGSESRKYSKAGEERNSEKAAGEGRERRAYPLAEEESCRLFISIGRSRRVFPREILGLINTETSVSKDDIGAIRILDNYSFIQVRITVADTIIEALNGKSFRGRTLTVNYARTRKDEDQDSTEPEQDSPDSTGESPLADESSSPMESDESPSSPIQDGDSSSDDESPSSPIQDGDSSSDEEH